LITESNGRLPHQRRLAGTGVAGKQDNLTGGEGEVQAFGDDLFPVFEVDPEVLHHLSGTHGVRLRQEIVSDGKTHGG